MLKESGGCSTPFGIRGILTVIFREKSRNYVDKCSTPFGIRGILTEKQEARTVPLVWCSTPFGIRGILTRLDTGGAGW